VNVDVVRPDELGEAELGQWRAFQAATPSLHNPFLSPEFTITVGRFRPRTRVGVLTDGGDVVGFFPFERAALGRGLPGTTSSSPRGTASPSARSPMPRSSSATRATPRRRPTW